MFIPDPLGNLGKIITKGMGKLKALSKPLREKIGGTFGKSNKPNRSGNKADFDPNKHKLNKVQLQKLNDDLADNKALKDAMDGVNGNPALVDSWKKLDGLGEAGELVRKNPEALKKVDDAIKEGLDATDAIKDAAQTLGKPKPTWDEIKVLFKRGNDYNAKARIKYGANRSEVVLKGVDGKAGKRLDTYIPPSNGKAGEIISRKATTLSEIQSNTFKNYLTELITKYPKGAKLNSSKFPPGTKLDGDYFLEIPTSNKSFFESNTEFQKILSDFNSSKSVDIKIKYLNE
ncbi:MAG: hypothetical protein ACJAWV_003625 [Flammeovirgaceae bacterium]|jgi:hypothetical protein